MEAEETFQTETFGKWILAGEHAVLRGVPALVLPAKNFSMKFSYAAKNLSSDLTANFVGERGHELQLIFWGLFENAMQKLGRARSAMNGQLTIESNLPLGAGLGASAALCVGLSRVFHFLNWLEEKNIYDFSRELENLFHGESSGVDIAIALEGRGLRFQRGGERTALDIKWAPKLYLSYSGKRGMTAECVRKVRELTERNQMLGQKIDMQMREAVEAAEAALAANDNLMADGQTRFEKLAHAIDHARDSFYQWGLCDGPLDQHLKELSRAGAYAVKPTGSGGGGYVLSLWQQDPPVEWQSKLTKLFD